VKGGERRMSGCPTCDLLAEWDEAMARVRASTSHRPLAQAKALVVAERIIGGIERHEGGTDGDKR
jgi:hypothetical protein